jgi:hypothetical protein
MFVYMQSALSCDCSWPSARQLPCHRVDLARQARPRTASYTGSSAPPVLHNPSPLLLDYRITHPLRLATPHITYNELNHSTIINQPTI